MSWRAVVLTLFPDMFPGPLGQSLAGRALADGLWSVETHDLRAHGLGRHRTVDDTPFGGGAGMVMRPDVIDAFNEAETERRSLGKEKREALERWGTHLSGVISGRTSNVVCLPRRAGVGE